LFVVVPVLVVGIALGVGLDRAYIRLSAGGSEARRSQLVGRWVGIPNGESLAFNADGTFSREMAQIDMREGKGGAVGRMPILGQWRWLDDDHIQMDSFGQHDDKARVVVEGGMMKLLRPNGDVHEYRRE
jgi:hypothetical protein